MDGTVGFVGVGQMGSRMAGNLLGAGVDVVVHDVDPDRVAEMEAAGAEAADSLEALAGAADVVCTSLPTAEVVESVYLEGGLLDAMTDGSVAVEMSTVPPGTVEAIEAAIGDRDLALLDCPVIGPPTEAAAATLTIVAGGSEAAFERVEPLLAHLGNRVEHVGGVGDGKRVKLANNVMTFGNYAVAAEMFALVDAMGIDPERFFDITDSGAAEAAIVGMKAPMAFAGDEEPGFPMSGARKDLRYALEMKEAADVSAPVAAATAEAYTLGAAKAGADADYSALVTVLRELAR